MFSDRIYARVQSHNVHLLDSDLTGADVPVKEKDPTVVSHIMMHDGPEGNTNKYKL